jgi:hypothetical protein
MAGQAGRLLRLPRRLQVGGVLALQVVYESSVVGLDVTPEQMKLEDKVRLCIALWPGTGIVRAPREWTRPPPWDAVQVLCAWPLAGQPQMFADVGGAEAWATLAQALAQALGRP